MANKVVSITDTGFSPDAVSIKVGESVDFKNDASAPHTVVFDPPFGGAAPNTVVPQAPFGNVPHSQGPNPQDPNYGTKGANPQPNVPPVKGSKSPVNPTHAAPHGPGNPLNPVAVPTGNPGTVPGGTHGLNPPNPGGPAGGQNTAPGATFTQKFDTAGTFTWHCDHAASPTGTVTVS